MKALTSLMIILAGVSFLTAQEVEVEGEIVEVRSVIDAQHDVEILEVQMQFFCLMVISTTLLIFQSL